MGRRPQANHLGTQIDHTVVFVVGNVTQCCVNGHDFFLWLGKAKPHYDLDASNVGASRLRAWDYMDRVNMSRYSSGVAMRGLVLWQ